MFSKKALIRCKRLASSHVDDNRKFACGSGLHRQGLRISNEFSCFCDGARIALYEFAGLSIDELLFKGSFVNLPDRLRDFGIEAHQLPGLARDAKTQWTGTFNPRPVSQAELEEIYRSAL